MRHRTSYCRSCDEAALRSVLSLDSRRCGRATHPDAHRPHHDAPGWVLAFCSNCTLVQVERCPSIRAGKRVPVQSSDTWGGTPSYDAMGFHDHVSSAGRLRGMQPRTFNADRMIDVFTARGVDGGRTAAGCEASDGLHVAGRRGDGSPPAANRIRMHPGRTKAGALIRCGRLHRAQDPDALVRAMAVRINNNGLGVIDVPHVRDLVDRYALERLDRDVVCHFSLRSLEHLCGRHALHINHVWPAHPRRRRLRVLVSRGSDTDATVESVRHDESAAGVHRTSYYEGFAQRLRTVRAWLADVLCSLKSTGRRVAAYAPGPAAAGFLNALNLPEGIFEFAVAPAGACMPVRLPGTGLNVVSSAVLRRVRPEYLLVLNGADAGEIAEREAAYVRRGGTIILPLPFPRLLRWSVPDQAPTGHAFWKRWNAFRVS